MKSKFCWMSLLIVLGSSSCGVKGKPLPPLKTPPIGGGSLDAEEFDRKEDQSKKK